MKICEKLQYLQLIWIILLCDWVVSVPSLDVSATVDYNITSENPRIQITSSILKDETKKFSVGVKLDTGKALQIRTTSNNPNENTPLNIFIEQSEHSSLLQLPPPKSGNASVISQTLCSDTLDDIISIQFTTHSKTKIQFTTEIYMFQYELTLNERIGNISVSKTESQVFYYNIPVDQYEVLLMLNNENSGPQCNLVAVHPAMDCPFPFIQDMESHLRSGHPTDYETMLEKGVMLISKDQKPDYGYNGINIYILGLDSEQCSTYPDNIMRGDSISNLSIVVKDISDDRIASTLITVVIYVLTCAIGMLMIIYGERCKIELIGNFDQAQFIMKKKLVRDKRNGHVNESLELSVSDLDETQTISVIGAVNSTIGLRESRKDSYESDFQNEFETPRHIIINEKNLTARTAYNKARSKEYSWLIITMGIYYAIPVIQLVLLLQSLSNIDGNRDLCYFNFECQYPWGITQDYGNVFSNIGYIFLGIFFCMLVSYRRYKYRCFKDFTMRFTDKKFGIPEQFGIFNSLGLALILEGLLSASYHVCPTEKSFQFDTTFMFFIAILLYLKIYQFRHPDVVQTARTIFLVVGITLILETLGYYIHSVFYYMTFTFIYLGIVFTFLINIYWNGDNPGILGTLKHTAKSLTLLLKNPRKLKKVSWMFFIPLVVNIGFATYILVTSQPTDDLSTTLLIIFMMNMFMYLAYYVSMKMWLFYVKKQKNEKILIKTWVYFLLANCFAWPSLYFFNTVERGTGSTPSESRVLNRPCTLGIFDSHDLWHFLSASALFFLYMFVLTLEDANIDMPRELIQIF